MAAIYQSRIWKGKEEWRSRTKIKVIKGISPLLISPYLWLSKKDATDDEPLFRFLKDSSGRRNLLLINLKYRIHLIIMNGL
jgi:hypothetical protein